MKIYVDSVIFETSDQKQVTTVTLRNERGEKFIQNLGTAGVLFIPANFQYATLEVEKNNGSEARFFQGKISPAELNKGKISILTPCEDKTDFNL